MAAIAVGAAGLATGVASSLRSGMTGIASSLRSGMTVTIAHAAERVRPPFNGRNQVNILLIGVDDKIERGRSDTLLLARLDTENRQIRALSIPRDTRTAIAGERGYNKINAAYPRGGAPLTVATIHKLTGVPIDYYVKTDFTGFKEMVDLVGGIEMDVERDMHYDDNWGNLHIHLARGAQHLDGEKAMEYIRYRKGNHRSRAGDGSDISRIQRQQKFLRALADRLMVVSNLPRLPQLVREAEGCVNTNLSQGDLIYLAGLAKELGSQQIRLETVPGRHALLGGVSYWLPDEEGLAQIVSDLFTNASALTRSGSAADALARTEVRG
jgi:polyisoprenyl-teichoic acid--peptidoglycan teichoic acid transferase